MPYDVESPYAPALGFLSSYMAGEQEKRKTQRGYQQQQVENAQNAARLQLAQEDAQHSSAKFAREEQGYANQAKLSTWDSANPQPSFDDTKGYAKWAAQRANAARSSGLDDQADKMATDYRSGEQAQLYAANAAYVADPKTNDTRAHTGLLNAQTQFESAHARNERGKYEQEMKKIGAAGAQRMEQVRARTSAMLQGQGARIAAQQGINAKNAEVREAIAMSTAMNAAQGRSESESFQVAMAEYKQNSTIYNRREAAHEKGTGAAPGAPPQFQMPSITANFANPAGQAPVYIVVPGPNGQPVVQQQRLSGSAEHKSNPASKGFTPVVNFSDFVGSVIDMVKQGRNDHQILMDAMKSNIDPQMVKHAITVAHQRSHENAFQNAWGHLTGTQGY